MRALSEQKDLRSILQMFQKTRLSGLKSAMEDIRAFAKFFGCEEAAVPEVLFGKGSSEAKANEVVLRYKKALEKNGKATGTVGRRISALRSLAKIAKGLGFISWSIEVTAETVRRDTRGLSASAERKIPWLLTRNDVKSRRDLAVLATIHELNSSRTETSLLDLESYDPDPRSPMLTTHEKVVEISVQSKKILDAWIEVRGLKAGALFTKLDEANEPTGERLTADDLIHVVRDSYDTDDDLV